MHPMLNVLDDIAFVLECAATECMGDGKFELDLLIGRLQRDPAYASKTKAPWRMRSARSCLPMFAAIGRVLQ